MNVVMLGRQKIGRWKNRFTAHLELLAAKLLNPHLDIFEDAQTNIRPNA